MSRQPGRGETRHGRLHRLPRGYRAIGRRVSQRRRRFAPFAKSKAAWRFASRRTRGRECFDHSRSTSAKFWHKLLQVRATLPVGPRPGYFFSSFFSSVFSSSFLTTTFSSAPVEISRLVSAAFRFLAPASVTFV